MANGLYDKYRESRGDESPSLRFLTDTIKISLVRGYTPVVGTHQFLSDVTGAGGTVVATQALGSKSFAAGVADAADVTFTAVATGAACAHLVIYKDTGVAGTSPLIALIDSYTGLPVTPNGGDIVVSFDNGANKIFKL